MRPRGRHAFLGEANRDDSEEISFPALHPIDNLGYCALNLLRDLLRVSIVTSQVYELAWFLHHNARNEEFWKSWNRVHDSELRRLESVSFLLANMVSLRPIGGGTGRDPAPSCEHKALVRDRRYVSVSDGLDASQ